MCSSLGARSTVRESTERDLLTRPAYGRPNTRTRRLNHPRHVFSLHAPSRRRRACGDYATSRSRARVAECPGARGTNANERTPLSRRRIQFARALASQRPPSRERPPLGGGGPGRAPSPSLCVSPFSRSIDDTEHGRRQVRGPPACSSAGTSLRARRRRRRRRPYAKNHICRRSRRLVDDPRAVGPKGPWRRPGAAGLPSRTLCGGAASVEDAAGRAAPCSHGTDGPRQGPSATPQKTGFKPHELNSCVGGAKS